jgi:dihydropteridine reductase
MPPRHALVIGGGGALGRAALAAFSRAGWRTTAADLPQAAPPLGGASAFVALEAGAGAEAHCAALLAALPAGGAPLDAVFCAAGGWAGGAARDEAFLAAAARMHEVCLQPAAVAARVAALRLRASDEGAGEGAGEAPALLVLTGAAAALAPRDCAGMLGYGMAKAATHFAARALAAEGALPRGTRALALLPRVLDTPANRQHMAGADTSAWTPPEHLAAQLVAWCGGGTPGAGPTPGLLPLPKSGSLVLAETAAGVTTFRVVDE